MVSQILIAIGFLAATAAVIALARGSTARWERDRRAPVAARPDDPARPMSWPVTWLRSAAARQAVDALRRHTARLVPSGLRSRLRRTGPRPAGLPATPPGDQQPSAPSGVGSRAATDRWPPGVRGRALLRRTAPRVRRSALALLHRHGESGSARASREDSGDRPTAR